MSGIHRRNLSSHVFDNSGKISFSNGYINSWAWNNSWRRWLVVEKTRVTSTGEKRNQSIGFCSLLSRSLFLEFYRQLLTLADSYRRLPTFTDICRQVLMFTDRCRYFPTSFADLCRPHFQEIFVYVLYNSMCSWTESCSSKCQYQQSVDRLF